MSRATITLKRQSSLSYGFLMLMIFLVGFDFMGQGSKLQIILLGYALLNMPRNLKISSMEWLLLLYVIACAVGRIISGVGLTITYISTNLVAPILMFSTGKMMVTNSKGNKQVKYAMLSVFSGFVLQAFIVLSRSIVSGQAYRLAISSMWGVEYTAIQQIMYATAATSLGIYFIAYAERRGERILGIIFFALSMVNSVYFASRSGLYVMVIVFAVFLVQNVFWRKKLVVVKRLIYLAVSLVVLLGIMQLLELLDIKAIWESTNLYDRLFVTRAGLDATGRVQQWQTGLSYLLQHPLGYEYQYAHNMWIDLGLECGVFAMLLLVAYTLVSVRDIIRLQKLPDADMNIQCIAMCLTVGHLVAFCVEPALQGVPLLVSMLFALNGIVRGYLVKLECSVQDY